MRNIDISNITDALIQGFSYRWLKLVNTVSHTSISTMQAVIIFTIIRSVIILTITNVSSLVDIIYSLIKITTLLPPYR